MWWHAWHACVEVQLGVHRYETHWSAGIAEWRKSVFTGKKRRRVD